MTLPRIESEKKARLFNRANQYRLNNEFDKAYDAYEAIVEEDEQEAEGYWGMILSEYGVEYVEDPKSGKRVPTCHRTKVQSITSSVNFKHAIQYADAESKFIYQDEAEVLDKLQKNIIAVSAKEEPYDVFICYKETDESTGERSKDSVLAQQVYDALQDKGIRTFFARISLEDKVGQNYEPFIYAALKSARVMILVSTSNDNCNATWVKNEWMRFIQFMDEDKNKSIIPACSGMSPYELPDELTSFQAQDMNKVGAVQDLVYGVTKLLGKAPRESNNQILNELLNDKVSREKKNAFIIRLLVGILTVGAVLFTGLLFSEISSFSNGYARLTLMDMAKRFREPLLTFLVISGISLLCSGIGLVWGLTKGYTKPWPKRLFTVGLAILNIGILITRMNGFLIPGIKYLNYINLLFVAAVAIMQVNKDRVVEVITRGVVLLVCAIIGFTNLGFKKADIANSDSITSKNQVYVNGVYTNIREKATSKSPKLGEAYKGMIFDIVEEETSGENVWFKIHTNNGIEGYINEEYASKTFEILITDDYINVREKPGTSNSIVGKVYSKEKYIAVIADEMGSRTWYRITLKDGTVGYIGASGIKQLK